MRLPSRWAVVLELPPTKSHPVVVRSPMTTSFTRRGSLRRFDRVLVDPSVRKAILNEGAKVVVRRLDPAGFVIVPEPARG